MVNISLLLPTRGRPHLVSRLFDSLAETTTDLENLEIILYIDEDDIASQEIFHPTLDLVKLIRPPGETMGSITRACYEASHGRYVMLMNDDVIFHTKGWDDRIVWAFGQFPDEIALVYGNDLDQGKAVPTFPIVSRTACELLGEICPRGYRNLHIESHLFDIFKQLLRFGYNRIIYLEDVVFEHMHYAVGKAIRDETYVKKNKRNDDISFIALDDERRHKAKELAKHIEMKSGSPGISSKLKKEKQAYAKSGPNFKKLFKRVFYPFISKS